MARAVHPFLVTGFLLLAQAGAYAAPQSDEGWPPMAKEELTLKDNPADPGAPAMTLERDVLTDDVHAFSTFYKRIKVFNAKGQEYGDIEIPYDRGEHIKNVEARTILPDGKVIDFDGEVFEKTIAKARGVKVLEKTFTLPEVEPGSVIEYKFEVHWQTPSDYEVHNLALLMKESRISSFHTARWIIDDDLFTRHAHFTLRPFRSAELSWTWSGLPENVQPQAQPDGTVQLDVKNVPAFISESGMPPVDTLKGRVEFFYATGQITDKEASVTQFWKDQAKQRGVGWDEYIGDRKAIRRLAEDTVSESDSSATKLAKLYARAQQVRNLSFEPDKTAKEEKREKLKENDNVEDVVKHGYGYEQQINGLFVALARAAGFPAYIVQVANRADHFFNLRLLDWNQLDTDLVEVKDGQKDLYFDPGTPFCPASIVPWGESSTYGLRLDKDEGEVIKTTGLRSADAVVARRAALELDASGNAQGTVHLSYTGQEALVRRLEARDRDEAGRRKQLEDELKSWLPGGATVKLTGAKNWQGPDGPLEADFQITLPGFGSPAGRRLLVPASLFGSPDADFFQASKRLHPVYFSYPYQEQDDITLQVPKGYQVASLAPAETTPSAFGSYELSAENAAGALHVKRRLVVEAFIVPVDYYPAARAFFSAVRAGDENQAVLQTATAAQAVASH